MPRRWEILGRAFMVAWVLQLVLTIQTMATFHLPAGIFFANSLALVVLGAVHVWYWLRVAGSGNTTAGLVALVAMLVVTTAIELPSPAGLGIGLYVFAAILAGAAFTWRRSWIAILVVALVRSEEHTSELQSLR